MGHDWKKTSKQETCGQKKNAVFVFVVVFVFFYFHISLKSTGVQKWCVDGSTTSQIFRYSIKHEGDLNAIFQPTAVSLPCDRGSYIQQWSERFPVEIFKLKMEKLLAWLQFVRYPHITFKPAINKWEISQCILVIEKLFLE